MPACCFLDFCEEPGTKLCSACKEARYCCAEHQKQAWKSHKSECKINQEQRQQCADWMAQIEGKQTKETLVAAHGRLAKVTEMSWRNPERLLSLGALKAIVQASQLHHDDAAVQGKLFSMVFSLCFADSRADDVKRDLACEAGVIDIAVTALKEHSADAALVAGASQLIRKVVDGEEDAGVDKRCEQAMGRDAIESITAAMSATFISAAPEAAMRVAAQETCATLCILTFGGQ